MQSSLNNSTILSQVTTLKLKAWNLMENSLKTTAYEIHHMPGTVKGVQGFFDLTFKIKHKQHYFHTVGEVWEGNSLAQQQSGDLKPSRSSREPSLAVLSRRRLQQHLGWLKISASRWIISEPATHTRRESASNLGDARRAAAETTASGRRRAPRGAVHGTRATSGTSPPQ